MLIQRGAASRPADARGVGSKAQPTSFGHENELHQLTLGTGQSRIRVFDPHGSTWRPSPLSGGFKRNGYEHQFAAFFEDIACDRRGPTSIEHMLPLYELMDRIEATATHE